MTPPERLDAIARAAARWSDPDEPARADAVDAALGADHRFTEEGLAFSLNHAMQQLDASALRDWIGVPAAEPKTVVVVADARDPLGGWRETLAAVLLEHDAVVAVPTDTLPSDGVSLLPAFLDDAFGSAEFVRFGDLEEVLEDADALVASGEAEAMANLAERADEAGLPSARRQVHVPGFGVAVIDGSEPAEVRSGLAEDFLLHDGVGPRTVRVVWAPRGLAPDALLDTLAGFREIYPAHPATNGTLAMPTAFLASAKQSHATGPGFLVSRGTPDPQIPAHLRWTEYDALADVIGWLEDNQERVAFVVAAPSLAERIETTLPVVVPGDAHRPPLGAWSDVVDFLRTG